MPVLQAYALSHRFDNGDNLFTNLSCSMQLNRVGLVGRNGLGKSVLASILTGSIKPSAGEVRVPATHAIYRQDRKIEKAKSLTIAQFLGKELQLDALRHIEQGDCAAHWFDMVGDNWDLKEKLNAQLAAIGVPQQLDMPCQLLSGGQFSRLELCKLFQQDTELLVLDEPSNHLDSQGRLWLIEQIKLFTGAILLISHDRQLLREMEEIWELSSLGLKVYGGNFDSYSVQKRTEQEAVERELVNIAKQKKHAKQQAQLNREKAEQRAAQGNKLRKAGSQPKMYLDRKKDKAAAAAASRNKQEHRKQECILAKELSLAARFEASSKQSLSTFNGQQRSLTAFSLEDGALPFGCQKTLNWRVFANQKIHLAGANGSGKTTLLRVLQGKQKLLKGELRLNVATFYLDQHFGLINEQQTVVDNLMDKCDVLDESSARSLLAGIGFRREDVFRSAAVLSGGEKMKLSMLIATHQSSLPFLLLDEPDNHLDLESKRILAEALTEFQGGFLLISHDSDFVTDAGVSHRFNICDE